MASPDLPPALTPEVLDRWREACADAGAEIVNSLSAGLSDADIDAIVQPLGVPVPEELRTLWRWAVTNHDPRSVWDANGEFRLIPPDVAVSATATRRSLADEVGTRFPRQALVALEGDHGSAIVVRARAAEVLAYTDWEAPWPFAPARTLGELFSHWTQQILTGDLFVVQGRFDARDPYPDFWLPGRDPVRAERPLDDNGDPLPVPDAD